MAPKASDLYPEWAKSERFFDGPADYSPIVESFGTVVLRADEDGYSGDTSVLYSNDGRIGYLLFGWGSCSGCDALQLCSSIDDLQYLINKLESSVKWFETPAEALVYFKTHDWKGDYSWYSDYHRLFVADAIVYLEGLSDKLPQR